MEQNAQSNVPCKHGNFASHRNPLLGCTGRFYEYCNILLVDICLHFLNALRHQYSRSIMHNLPPFFLNFSIRCGSFPRESYINRSRLRLSLTCKNTQTILLKHLKQQPVPNKIPYTVLRNITQRPAVHGCNEGFYYKRHRLHKITKCKPEIEKKEVINCGMIILQHKKINVKPKKLQAQFLTRFLILLLMKRPCCNQEVAYCTDIGSTFL